MDLKEAWKIYSTKAHINRLKTRIKVSQAYEIIRPHLKEEEKKLLGAALVALYTNRGRGYFKAACDLVESRLFPAKPASSRRKA